MCKSKNDIAWDLLFKKYNVLDLLRSDHFMDISSTEINEIREARLMTKFDHKSQLPNIFQTNNLSILPNSRGGYRIGKYETFHNFEISNAEIQKIEFPFFLESLDITSITSESMAINCAYVSKILNDFTHESNLLPTVNGRMSSSIFEFRVNSSIGELDIKVENAQVEIDGGFEGDNSLILIEAKNYISDDFLIRQLYYPFRLWVNKVKKKVRPIFLTYTNGVFHLREYVFNDINHYNSLVLINDKKYAIKYGKINLQTIQEISDNIELVNEPDTPFPQANSFERIINLCELLETKGSLTKEEITLNYDFDNRQTDYYINASLYIGLIKFNKINDIYTCYLSPLGKSIFAQNLYERQLSFISLILSHKVFNDTLKLYFHKAEMPTKEEIVKLMIDSKLNNISSESTYFRRASTILGWLNWILNNIEE